MNNRPQQGRRSIRLQGYDYSQAGAYFVTVVTQGRKLLFGDVVGGEMRLNAAGEMAQRMWADLPGRFPDVDLDVFVVMPNHVHGIILIGEPARATTRFAPTLGEIVGAFKSIVTVGYSRGVRAGMWRPFRGRLWQRNYYEHVIRNEPQLDSAREYIVNNPLQWELDRENPVSTNR